VIIKAGDGKELIEQLKTGNLPDIVLLDLNMPGMNGYETARELLMNYPEVMIVILTMFNSELAIIRLLRLGVQAFVKKDTHPGDLRYALDTVIKSGYYYPPSVSAGLDGVFSVSQLKHAAKPLTLSKNETVFLKWVATDLTYRQIAKEMCVSTRTVENYCDSLKHKFSVKNRMGIAMYAVKNGLVDI
jgi:DNA-binding NarL/FixJ family response regulator